MPTFKEKTSQLLKFFAGKFSLPYEQTLATKKLIAATDSSSRRLPNTKLRCSPRKNAATADSNLTPQKNAKKKSAVFPHP